MAFLSWRGHDENLLKLMDEVMYDDDVDKMNDIHSSPHDWHSVVDFDLRASGLISSSGGDVGDDGEDSEVCCVPCDPVADGVPVAIDEEVDDRDELEDP